MPVGAESSAVAVSFFPARLERDPTIHAGGLLHHPPCAEQRSRTRTAGISHPLPKTVVLQQTDDRLRHSIVIARGNQNAGLAVGDDLWYPARSRRDDRFSRRHRVEQRRAESF